MKARANRAIDLDSDHRQLVIGLTETSLMFRSLLLPQYINQDVDGVLASLTGVPQISGCTGDPHPVKDGPTTDAKA